MPFLSLPNELLFLIGKEIERSRDLNSLIKTNHHLAVLLTPLLHEFAVKYKIGWYHSALIGAVAFGHLPLVKLLVEQKGYDVNDVMASTSPLHWAVASGHKEVVEYLIHKGADLFSTPYQLTVLGSAARAGHDSIVKLLLDEGANINGRERVSKRAPLHKAVSRGRESTVELLLENGADANIRNAKTVTPLWKAAKHGFTRIVQSLLDYGAEIDTQHTYSGTSEIFVAIERGRDPEIVRLILDHGANPNIVDANAMSPLHVAVKTGCLEVIEMLLEAGADVNAENIFGETPLDLATMQQRGDMIEVLTKAGAHTRVQIGFPECE